MVAYSYNSRLWEVVIGGSLSLRLAWATESYPSRSVWDIVRFCLTGGKKCFLHRVNTLNKWEISVKCLIQCLKTDLVVLFSSGTCPHWPALLSILCGSREHNSLRPTLKRSPPWWLIVVAPSLKAGSSFHGTLVALVFSQLCLSNKSSLWGESIEPICVWFSALLVTTCWLLLFNNHCLFLADFRSEFQECLVHY